MRRPPAVPAPAVAGAGCSCGGTPGRAGARTAVGRRTPARTGDMCTLETAARGASTLRARAPAHITRHELGQKHPPSSAGSIYTGTRAAGSRGGGHASCVERRPPRRTLSLELGVACAGCVTPEVS